MGIKIALAGNPNAGKTTLFNALTGANQFVGNWPGVTVEKKEGKLKKHKDVTLVDLPGIYSLSPYTLEEVVARNYLIEEKPDAILNIVDGSNIERNLYLTNQLSELGIPMLVVINMMDIVRKRGDEISIENLSKAVGCPVVEISALKNEGVFEAANKVVELASSQNAVEPQHKFSDEIVEAIEAIKTMVPADLSEVEKKWFALKLFERDEKIAEKLAISEASLAKIESEILKAEEKLDDDSESLITSERYEYISSIIDGCIKRNQENTLTTSDKIDRIVTNRWLGLPIFAAVMFVVYYLSIHTIGTWATDWANDGLFGDGFFLFGKGSAKYEEVVGDYDVAQVKIEAFEEAAKEANQKPESASSLVAKAELRDDEGVIEEVVDVNFADYKEALKIEEPDPADYGTWVRGVPIVVDEFLTNLDVAPWLHALIIDGIVAGVGAVLGFVPQMLVLFLLLAFLEGCGYMARVAFVMDRIFRNFGLSGKSFIPMLVGTGCSVPGIMASRTIENVRDRRMTIITTSFIPCSAKLPIIALIAGALFDKSPAIGVSAYFVGMAAIICSGIILKKTKLFSGDPAPFVMELPAYHMPTIGSVLRSMWERGWSFIKKAGTVILLSTILIWFGSSYGFEDGKFGAVDMENSILAIVSGYIAWIFIPLGWGNWRSAAGAITGLIAKENVVATLGILYAGSEVAANGWEIWNNMREAFSPAAAYSFLVFNLLCAPCFAAIGAIRREMNSGKWTWFALGYQTGLAYVVSLCVYNIGLLISGQGFNLWTGVSFILVAIAVYLLVRPERSELQK